MHSNGGDLASQWRPQPRRTTVLSPSLKNQCQFDGDHSDGIATSGNSEPKLQQKSVSVVAECFLKSNLTHVDSLKCKRMNIDNAALAGHLNHCKQPRNRKVVLKPLLTLLLQSLSITAAVALLLFFCKQAAMIVGCVKQKNSDS